MIMLMVTQFVLIRNDAAIIHRTLKLRNKVLLGAFSATLSVALAAILVGSWKLGVIGLCLGFIAGRSTLSLASPWIVGLALGISFDTQLSNVLRPALITALVRCDAGAGLHHRRDELVRARVRNRAHARIGGTRGVLPGSIGHTAQAAADAGRPVIRVGFLAPFDEPRRLIQCGPSPIMPQPPRSGAPRR